MKCQRPIFDIPDDVHYINCAYMSPMPHKTQEVGFEAIRKKGQPFLYRKEDFFEPTQLAQKLFNDLIHGDDPDRICIIPSVSYGMANVAHNVSLKAGENIVVLSQQFPSNIYPWIELVEKSDGKLVIVDRPDSKNISREWTAEIIKSINEKTRVVALPHVHWADGIRIDLEKISYKAKSVGALLIIDGTQSIGAMPFDNSRIKADAICCASYKWLMGPYSIGLAYYGPYFDNKKPIEHNWINRHESDNFQNLVKYQPKFRPKAGRFAVGEQSNFILLKMMIESLRQVADWGTENIQQYCREIGQGPLALLEEAGFQVAGPENRGHHLLGIGLDYDTDVDELKKILFQNKIYVSFRGNSIRISPNVYNTHRDIETLASCLIENL